MRSQSQRVSKGAQAPGMEEVKVRGSDKQESVGFLSKHLLKSRALIGK